MDAKEFIEIYKTLILIAFGISVVNWIGYSVLAPWWRTWLGRIIWTKFLANCLLLFTPFAQIVWKDSSFRYEFSLFAMGLFILSITTVAYGIYTTQIRGYITYRKALRKANSNADSQQQ